MIKGEEYPIRLPDGHYTIRKLTVTECERLQTLPDGFTAHGLNENSNETKISDTQRYRVIGNGWTADVIAHILKYIHAAKEPKYDYAEQVKMEF